MIIWLASYPKSGNTWVRSFISSILFSKDGKANFDDMDKIKQFPSRRYFKNLVKNFQDIKIKYSISNEKLSKVMNIRNLDCYLSLQTIVSQQ